jgi:DNA-binding transcriptional ArsR family regulator
VAEPPADIADLLPEPARDFLKALASETRQQILLLFIGGATLTVGEVAGRLGIGQSTASEHLALLRRGGLLSAQRSGKLVSYRANPSTVAERLAQLQAFLTCCCPPGDNLTAERADRRAPSQ